MLGLEDSSPFEQVNNIDSLPITNWRRLASRRLDRTASVLANSTVVISSLRDEGSIKCGWALVTDIILRGPSKNLS